jgi:hypothetical protein
MCRSNRITDNKSNCNIYLWCKEKKTDIILNYIFENTDGFIKDKVFIYNTNKQLIEKHIIKKSITNIVNKNITTDNNITKANLLKYIENNNILIDFDYNFIDDFYSFYDKNQNEYDYTIELNKLAYWLENRKDNLKVLLQSKFIENKDYIIESTKTNGIGKGKGCY